MKATNSRQFFVCGILLVGFLILTNCSKTEKPTGSGTQEAEVVAQSTSAPTPKPPSVVGVWRHQWIYTLIKGKLNNEDYLLEIMEDGSARLSLSNPGRNWINGNWSLSEDRLDVNLDIDGKFLTRKLILKEQALCIDGKGFIRGETDCYKRMHPGNTGGDFSGTIGGKYKINMTLDVVDGRIVNGSYRYVSKGVPIILKGTLNAIGCLMLTEIVDGKVTGSFDGLLAVDGFSGEWSNPDRNKAFYFLLKRITPNP